LIVGAPGSGKSSLATCYAHAAARNGQPAAVFLFDESVHTLMSRSAGLGMNLEKFRREGTLTVQQVDPAELSPGEFAHTIRREVEDNGARLVIIDSLSGYLNAMPAERHLDHPAPRAALVSRTTRVATILIGAHQGLVGGPMQTPVDASYLADAVILLRYYESEGEIHQAISVIKKRGSAHERTIREFSMSAAGIHVGPSLRRFKGVLTGVPTVEPPAPEPKAGRRSR
jgi:circadian clock protein KaiC